MTDDVRISVDQAEGLSRRIRIDVPAARITSEVDGRLRSAAAEINLKGFRPGKVPQDVIRQRFGDQARRQVIEELVQSTLSDALSRANLRPVSNPQIDLISDASADGSDLSFTASFEIYPDVAVQGLDDLTIRRLSPAMDDADVEFVIDNLRRQRATSRPVNRESRDGDRITLTYSGSIDGFAIPGSGQPVSLVLGAGRMGPDIERQLVGIRPGEERTIRATLAEFPAGPALAGRLADLSVTVTEVAEEDLPEVDDAFIRGFEVASGNRDEFVALVKQYMKDEFEARSRADVQRQIATHLLQRNPLSVPAALVDQEIEEMRAEAGAATAAPPSRTVAEDRARINLINATIIREQGIKVDHGRVRARIDEMAVGEPDADAFRNRYFQNPSLLAGIEAQVLNEQVVDWLLSKAAVTDMPSSFRSLKDL